MRHPWVNLCVHVSSLSSGESVGRPCPRVVAFSQCLWSLPAGQRRRQSSADTTTSHPALVVQPASAVSLLLFCRGVNALILPAGKDHELFVKGCLRVSDPPPHAFSGRSGKSSVVCVSPHHCSSSRGLSDPPMLRQGLVRLCS